MKPFGMVMVALVILGLLIFSLDMIASAYTAPDNYQINTVRVFRHMLEPNDVLMMIQFDVLWGNITDQPKEPISQTFEITYTSGNGTLLGNTSDSDYGGSTIPGLFNLGYAENLAAFYWADDNPLKPTYGDLGNVTITDLGNATTTDTYILQMSNYSPYEKPSEIREDLRQWTINELIFINWDWNQWYTENEYTSTVVNLLAVFDTYTVLDSAGEAYMQSVQADFREMCPALFLFNSATYDYTNQEWTLDQQSIYESEHTSDLIGNITKQVKTFLGDKIPIIWITTFGTLVVAGILLVSCNYWWLQAKIGALGGYLIILVATPQGFFQMGLMALIAVGAVIYLVYTFFWRPSTG